MNERLPSSHHSIQREGTAGVRQSDNKKQWGENGKVEEKIRFIIRRVLKRTGFVLEIKVDRCGTNMTYDFIHDYVTFDPDRIVQAVSEQKVPVDLDAYVTAITLHELGHAIDRKALLDSVARSIEVFNSKRGIPVQAQYRDPAILQMLIGEEERNLVFEKTAWENAEMLNAMHRFVDPAKFNPIAAQSLGTYEKKLAGLVGKMTELNGSATA